MDEKNRYKDMLGRAEVVTVEGATKLFYDNFRVPELASEEINVEDALGRVVAEQVVSDSMLPEFARSSMDGYALAARDTFGASDALPAYLAVVGEVLMGEEALTPVEKGRAVRISTGGMLPPGADAVVMLEHTQSLGGAEIEISRPAAPGENVVQPGDDIKKGEVVLRKGHRLRPQDMGALAGIGVTKVKVYRRPRVAIINTGNEIIDASLSPAPGQVRDVNSYNLAGLVRQAGGEPVRMGIFRDDYDSIKSAVEAGISDADAVAITGGSSVGTGDQTAKVINDTGRPGVLVHGVSVKPGKPVIIGVAGGKPVFGLPGHPVAVTVTFELFLGPLISKLSGEVDPLGIAGIPKTRVVRAKMARNYSSAPGREDHLRVALEMRDGEIMARPVLGKSGLISTLVNAQGTVVVPPGKPGVEKGEWVDVRLFD
ncbi:MAG TPA: gephyrin-like molybdotransferase Glp [Nitrospirota bacterium]|nr:gephyrin-like molybdotransferase Glp [Nitrospirota bacterium]